MKKISLIVFAFALLTAGAANNQEKENKKQAPVLEFETLVLEKNAKKDQAVVFEFPFTNTGNEPLIISEVKASCGCTVPFYTKDPIMPGERDEIRAEYNAKKAGPFTKTVRVTSNATEQPITLRIKGNVAEK